MTLMQPPNLMQPPHLEISVALTPDQVEIFQGETFLATILVGRSQKPRDGYICIPAFGFCDADQREGWVWISDLKGCTLNAKLTIDIVKHIPARHDYVLPKNQQSKISQRCKPAKGIQLIGKIFKIGAQQLFVSSDQHTNSKWPFPHPPTK